MLLTGSQAVVHWVGAGLGIEDFGPCSSIAVLTKGHLVAGVVYSNFRWPDIEASIYASTPEWATKAHLRGVIGYPFFQLGCKRISATAGAMNQPARAFLCRLGFREEGVRPDARPDGDAVLYGLLRRDAARWLPALDHEGHA